MQRIFDKCKVNLTWTLSILESIFRPVKIVLDFVAELWYTAV